MAANKRKILESARKYSQKGAKEKALAEYQKLIRLDPKDAKLRLEVGDAYRRWGQVEEAIDTYSRVAQQYMTEGFDARAVAVYKQILNLDPDRFAFYEPLAELYERMGLTAEAIQALQTAADGFHRVGKKREALDLLRKMASVDASNTTSRIKVADLLRQEGMHKEAVAEYSQAAAELERQGDVESLSNVYRRILELDESNVEALASLVRNLAARGKTTEVVPLAERALELESGNPERYEGLADAYRSCGREQDAAGVYRRLAELYRERGDEDKAREIVQRHVPVEDLSVSAGEAGEADELSGTAFLHEDTGESLFGDEFPDTDGAPAADLGLDTGASPQMLGEEASPMAPSLEAPAPAAPPEPLLEEPGAALPPPTELDVEQLIAEASVYLRYGKREKAVSHLEAVLAAEPEHRAALEKLGEAFADGGEPGRAVEAWLRAAKRAREEGDPEALAVLRGRIAALDEAAAATLDASGAEPSAPPPSDAADGEERGPEIELDLSEAEEDLVLEDDELLSGEEHEDVTAAPDLAVEEELAEPPRSVAETADVSLDASSLSTATTQQILEDLEEADFYMQQSLLDEAEEIYQRVLSVAPNHPRALVRLGEVAEARGSAPSPPPASAAAPTPAEPAGGVAEEAVEIDIAVDVEDAFEEAAPAPVSAREPDEDAEEAPPEISVDLSDVTLEEGEDAISGDSGLEDLSDLDLHGEEAMGEGEADGEGSDTEELTPSLDPAAEASGAEPPVAAEPGVPESEEGDAGFDLAAALSDAFDDDSNGATTSGLRPAEDDGFEAVFDAFKKGVSETLEEGDHQAHYDLAIAYKEMGLLDDAVAELRRAMGDPARRGQCLHLMGVCAIDGGQERQAVEYLGELLALGDLSDEQRLAGGFDLGRAYQALGDVPRARQAYEAVIAVRADFQDVRARLACLDAPAPAEPEDEADGFESFDDVMADVGESSEETDPAGETFDDLVAEANAPAEAGEGPGADASLSAGEAVVEALEDAELEAEPEPAPAAKPRALPRRPKKKKKISFL